MSWKYEGVFFAVFPQFDDYSDGLDHVANLIGISGADLEGIVQQAYDLYDDEDEDYRHSMIYLKQRCESLFRNVCIPAPGNSKRVSIGMHLG